MKVDAVGTLCELRKNWTLEGFKEAYSDEWEVIPANLDDCHEMMEEYIYHTYDNDFILELIKEEKVR